MSSSGGVKTHFAKEKEIMDDSHKMEAFQFKLPFNMVFSGASGSGKSHLVVEILKHEGQLIHLQINKIYWCYDEWQQLYSSLAMDPILGKMLTFMREFPTEDLFSLSKDHRLVISDDLKGESSTQLLNKIFT